MCNGPIGQQPAWSIDFSNDDLGADPITATSGAIRRRRGTTVAHTASGDAGKQEGRARDLTGSTLGRAGAHNSAVSQTFRVIESREGVSAFLCQFQGRP